MLFTSSDNGHSHTNDIVFQSLCFSWVWDVQHDSTPQTQLQKELVTCVVLLFTYSRTVVLKMRGDSDASVQCVSCALGGTLWSDW